MNQPKQLLIGRYEEQRVLDAVFNSRSAEFIAIYGRRRVGKTYLVKTVSQHKDAVFFHVTGTRDATMAEQIDDFFTVLEATFYNNNIKIERPSSWKKAFEHLTNTIKREVKNKNVILFFDELPWLASKRSRFVQALDYYWNRYWSDIPHIKLIVCGSAASWMIDNVISHTGGLHNRITGQIALAPFDIKETKEYLLYKGIKYSDSQVLEIFMAIGGVPYYLNFLKKNFSPAQNLDFICFQNKGALVEEFSRLYASLFQHSESYEELVRIIASKRRGMERREIIKKASLSTDGGRLKERLRGLEQSGFIVGFTPYGFLKRRAFYRIIDEYSLFYLNWIETALSSIRKLDKTKGYWMEKCQSPGWRAWAGYAFESVCYKHVAQIRKSLNIPASAEIGSWQFIPKKGAKEDGAQIDLLFDRADGMITICEMKYTSQPYQLTKEEAHQIMKKIDIFKRHTKTTKQIQIVLVTNVPIKNTMYSEELVMHNVILQDLLH